MTVIAIKAGLDLSTAVDEGQYMNLTPELLAIALFQAHHGTAITPVGGLWEEHVELARKALEVLNA
jgi:hypothetical protein